MFDLRRELYRIFGVDAMLLCVCILGSATGCSRDTGSFAEPQQGYKITVTGAATGAPGYILQRSTSVTLSLL